MQSRVQVVVSDCPALSEVAGDKGLKREPTDYIKFSEVIIKL